MFGSFTIVKISLLCITQAIDIVGSARISWLRLALKSEGSILTWRSMGLERVGSVRSKILRKSPLDLSFSRFDVLAKG